MLSDLTPPERFVYEWQYHMLGGFYSLLAETIAKADDVQKRKLNLVYPDEVAGIASFQRIPGWWEAVCEKARTFPPRD